MNITNHFLAEVVYFLLLPKIQMIMPTIFIKSEHLYLTEPLMAKYYDFHSTMFIDEIKHCVENSKVNYKKRINGVLKVDYEETFRENKDLIFAVTAPYKKEIYEYFKDYFIVLDADSEEEEIITEDDLVMLSLTFISYVYQKEIKGLFQHSFIIDALDLEYESVLHKHIYIF